MTGRFLIMVEWRGGVQAMLKIRHHWGKQLKKDNGEYCMSMLSIGATASQVVTRRGTERERLGVAQGCSRHTAVFPLVGQREMTHIAQNQRINWDSPIREVDREVWSQWSAQQLWPWLYSKRSDHVEWHTQPSLQSQHLTRHWLLVKSMEHGGCGPAAMAAPSPFFNTALILK